MLVGLNKTLMVITPPHLLPV